ncbi:hypothetical protein ThrDRAFT_01167 [Frankia casuarinae]|jgi:aminoglycoside phosphotransferase (APT) family kinase protein|uniref:Aminoglycoside phosphotransferase domain-containing protein n=1 Tax=Frankia casuarinae (strain DSM 45818 / CECT 9043 / HFP020203 / CcI3) TaxID=106370 RepID=Q2JAE9_FRACC|nr:MULTISPECIES: aminoglycoside phosphotransferase family protein [Frankia]ABD11743.1 conserved hypothetical protein [Frankia casuarinae]ETA03420.1 hypothetical protein CcI6DRAFT_01136 [Frankia sp. CcI6]EYT93197.1 hypothetical protein ThrDRAFT_01167 [Frankia casuarinae]KDA41027.1 hypothetical protein BMG523Draft_04148 [Frankia sp. BMG5.23]TFE32844.1 aminoglycoside phosphotransferase family protein [Frankia sp. B2]
MSGQHRDKPSGDSTELLRTACVHAGVPYGSAELLREGENTIFRLPGGIIARISRAGQEKVAAKEVTVSRWLEENGFPAVRALALPGAAHQPVVISGHAVTFWQELPPHRHGTPREVAAALRALHAIPPPTGFTLDPLSPMTRLRERIEGARTLTAADRHWLRNRVETLTSRYNSLPPGLPLSAVHGDAWGGNLVVTPDGQTVLLDLERFSIGPPEWDLVSTAIKHSSFAWITAGEYAEFVEVYGHDVTNWSGFETLRDIRELRMACYVAQQASKDDGWQSEARKRVDSIRGLLGPRPWPWQPAL